MTTRISTGAIVHTTSIIVLCVVREGTGLFFSLKRTVQMARSANTNSTITVMMMLMKMLKLWICSMIGVTASWKLICQSLGCPMLANAGEAESARIGAVKNRAAKREPNVMSGA